MSELMVRGSLARAYLQKAAFDCEHQRSVDTQTWYRLPPSQMPRLPHHLQHSFVQLHFDPETQAFLDASKAQSDSVCLQLWYGFASWILSFRLSKTSINGILGRGSMFLFSRHQLAAFLGLDDSWDSSGKAVLDLGAGDGAVTAVMQHFFPNVYVTEASQPMLWRLAERHFIPLSLQDWTECPARLHLISALNLLDRHPEPFTFLKQLRALSVRNHYAPILLAAVFPWYQYSEFSSSHVPKDRIVLARGGFGEQVEQFVSDVLTPHGFRLLRWAKAPYLCEGDAYQSYYILYDALFLLVPSDSESS